MLKGMFFLCFFNSPLFILTLQLKYTISDLPLVSYLNLNIISSLAISHMLSQAASFMKRNTMQTLQT